MSKLTVRERLEEIAYRDSAVKVTVCTEDLKALLNEGGEVERLRADLETVKADRDAFGQNAIVLRAQLRAQDALLDEAYRHDIGTPLKRKIRVLHAELSASAEPCPDCKSSAPVKLDERAEFEKRFGNCTWGEDDYADEQRGWEARAALERKP